MTAELVSREKQIHLLQAQKEAIERNCVQLTEALKAANEKNIELLKQVTNKNTFIRNCL